jgi:LPXTG-motif cell wall-anchored protein
MLFLASLAPANVWNKKTHLTVSQTIEVPGAVLPPGEYVMKLVGSDANRHVVTFMNDDESEVLSTVIALPNRRLKVTGDTQFAWYETPAGQPPALRAWFFPGDNFGQEFVYPDGRAATLARDADRDVLAARDVQKDSDPGALQSAQVTTITPTQERETDIAQAQERNEVRDRQRPVTRSNPPVTAEPEMIAQAQPRQQAEPQQQRQPQQQHQPQQRAEPQELPETAGSAPLLALLGLGSLGGAAVLHRIRRKLAETSK